MAASALPAPALNVWGTPVDAIDPNEYCPQCEHSRADWPMAHYSNCPLIQL